MAKFDTFIWVISAWSSNFCIICEGEEGRGEVRGLVFVVILFEKGGRYPECLVKEPKVTFWESLCEFN